MQSPPLPIQLTSPSPAPASARKQNGPADGALPFSAALSREMDQRAMPPAPAPQAKPGAPAPNAPAPKQAEKQADKQEQPEQAAKADAPDSAAAPAPTSPQADKGDKADSTAADAASADGAAQAANPMLDLMALGASYNQPLAAVPAAATAAAAAAGAADAAAAGVGQRLPGDLPADVATQLPLAAAARLAGQAVPAAKAGATAAPAGALDSAFSNMMGKAGGAMQDSLEAAAAKLAQPGATGVQAQARPQGAPPAEPLRADPAGLAPAAAGTAAPAQLAATVQREAPADVPAPLKDAALPAIAAAPLQQAALAPLQGAAALHAGERIAARVGTPAWDNQVAQKIVWMVAGKEQSATLTLNPPDMGPMQVVLSVTNDQATVTFSAAQPEVRQALQDALPKLREMMGENGIALGNASVHDGSAGQQQAQQGEPGRSGGAQGHGRVASGSASEAQARVDARPPRRGETPGMVDTFA